MQPIMLVVGTRPEGIKMMPLYFALKKSSIPVYLCSTSQHDTLLAQVFEVFGVKPDYDLSIMQAGQDLFHITNAILIGMKKVYELINPSMVLVQGDTTTVMAAALAAFYKHIPVGHVEAGLRTGDMQAPYPEEMNRVFLGIIADLHFAPTAYSAAHLLAEGKKRESVFCTGNTVVDALRMMQEKIIDNEIIIDQSLKRIVEHAHLLSQNIILLTAHRRESYDNGGIVRILQAVKEYAKNHPELLFIFPAHPNPHVIQAIELVALHEVKTIKIIPAVIYKDLVYLLMQVSAVITDSGGIQEEAISLGKPTIVVREKSERMEGVWQGLAELVGTDKQAIKVALDKALLKNEHKNQHNAVYGDGYAAEKIVRIIQMYEKKRVSEQAFLFDLHHEQKRL